MSGKGAKSEGGAFKETQGFIRLYSETFAKYFEVADKEQKNVFSNLVRGGHSFFNYFEGLLNKKKESLI